MLHENYIIQPLSERAVLVQFEDVLSERINAQVTALHAALLNNPFPGYVESVPGYSSLGIFFDTEQLGPLTGQLVSQLEQYIHKAFAQADLSQTSYGNIIEIPVRYGGDDGPDIEFVAAQNNITVEEVIRIHSEKVYTVFMLGFLPGFAYMGITDQRITVDRKETPRLLVPAGSVALAGNQTGIYPADSPGGWQVIGRTDMVMFDEKKEPANFLMAGDKVKFIPV